MVDGRGWAPPGRPATGQFGAPSPVAGVAAAVQRAERQSAERGAAQWNLIMTEPKAQPRPSRDPAADDADYSSVQHSVAAACTACTARFGFTPP